MADSIYFSKFITKSLTALDSDRRLFEGILTVEMVDKQNEITVVRELLKVLPVWMARNAPITDTHSNRVIGRGINFSPTTIKNEDGEELPAIVIQGEIFKDYTLDTEVWEAIKSGEYKGLSFGGATKADRRPVLQKDGSTAFSLRDLEHYEVAVCPDPAVPLALITQFNEVAKSMLGKKAKARGDGTMVIQCTNFGCYVDKAVPETPMRTSDPPDDPASKRKTLEIDKPHLEGAEWSDNKPQPDHPAKKPPTVDDHTNPQQPYSGTGKEKNTKEKTIAHVESLNTEVPLRGIRGVGYTGQSDPVTGEKEKDGNDEKKSDYDMTGIVNDPKEEDDDKKKTAPVPQTISANEGIRGKPEGVVDDPEVVEKDKADIVNLVGSGTKGSYETAEQGSHDTRQISNIKDEKIDEKESKKQNNNYINMQTNIKGNNMAEEDKKPEEEKVEEKKSETETQKSTTDIAEKLNTISQAIAKFDTSKIEKSLEELTSRVKALEEPTDLPLKPKVQADDDIGAKVKVPDTYQSNSQQASIRDSDPQNENEKDEGKLTMQEKSEKTAKPEPVEKSLDVPVITTDTPRPGGVRENIEKSVGDGLNPILKAARESGYDGLSGVARDILAGKFYKPTPEEVGQW